MKTEIAEADVAELLQSSTPWRPSPDMNKDLRLGFALDDFANKVEEFDGDHAVERRHGMQGLPGRVEACPAGAEESIRNMADARRRTIKAVYEDPASAA